MKLVMTTSIHIVSVVDSRTLEAKKTRVIDSLEFNLIH